MKKYRQKKQTAKLLWRYVYVRKTLKQSKLWKGKGYEKSIHGELVGYIFVPPKSRILFSFPSAKQREVLFYEHILLKIGCRLAGGPDDE